MQSCFGNFLDAIHMRTMHGSSASNCNAVFDAIRCELLHEIVIGKAAVQTRLAPNSLIVKLFHMREEFFGGGDHCKFVVQCVGTADFTLKRNGGTSFTCDGN